jgi:hypothetical protein
MRIRILLIGTFFLSSVAPAMLGAQSAEYLALRSATPNGQAIAVQSIVLDRGGFRLHLEKGIVTFLSPAAGRTTGAVFSGEGSYELAPGSATERAYLAFRTGQKDLAKLTDSFARALFLFTDGTEGELRKAAAAAGGPDPDAASTLERFRREERREFRTNFDLRLLEDLLGATPPNRGVFLAFVAGKRIAPSLLAYDPRGVSHLRLATDLGPSTTLLATAKGGATEYLYVSPPESTISVDPFPSARATSYVLETRIAKDVRVSGTATILIEPRSAGARLLAIQLAPRLRLSEASIGIEGPSPQLQPADIVQEKPDEDADAAMILAAPLEIGRTYRLRLAYSGKDVLRNAGDGNYAVGARESWYPNFGTLREPAAFDLTFRIPKDRQVIAVGNPQEDRLEGDERVVHWVSTRKLRVAGFNYGTFRKLEKKDESTGTLIQVFTNPGTPDIITEINRALRASHDPQPGTGGSPFASDPDNPYTPIPSDYGRQSLTVNTDSLAESAMADGLNMSRVGTSFFGPLFYERVAITQQSQWSFGQSWPQLIYLPYVAFLDSQVRLELGLTDRGIGDFVDAVGPHEFSHQWWGHLVGWDTYRDQWLSEGFAEFSTSLVLQNARGAARAGAFWEKARKMITGRTPGSSVPNAGAGPISLGWRLATDKSPGAYQAMVYSKGAYVLQMLRMLMWESGKPQPDGAFSEMMKDFVRTYADRNPSSGDFQHVVEKHMTPSMNATRDGKMDWFFDEWVRGTEIPHYVVKLDIDKVSGNTYRLHGSLAQSGVSNDFRMLVPIYLELSKGRVGRIGVVPMVGNATVPIDTQLDLPEKPKRALVNALHDVLSTD